MFRGERLRRREVIDARTAERLGCVWDLEIDEREGRVTALIVMRGGWIRRLLGTGELAIPWPEVIAVSDKFVLADTRGMYIK